ncbi:MAG TPA: acyl-CoA dehydrogenase family protein [Polyangiaceae bacterium]
MAFVQLPPALDNQCTSDRVLRSYLKRTLAPDVLSEVEPSLEAMGLLAGGPLYELQLADRCNEPSLVQWDAWGRRIDHIEVSPLWKLAARLAAEHGVIAVAYERAHGELSRVHQFALAYLFDPSTDVYMCPLAMSDGAAKTLLFHRNRALIERAVPRLTSRDPDQAWTSGQWMTERTGGSDVGLTETVAQNEGDRWRLFGTKWFTSATTSPMALTLARPEGNPGGGRGLALFYIETRDEHGALREGIFVNRLKDKLGTRKVPTAELLLDGAVALPVNGLADGVRNIAPMLTATRIWNAIGAVSAMRRGLALSRDYARKRIAFGASLAEKPLHVETLADLQAEFEGAFHLAFRAVELLGREEAGVQSPRETEVLRLVTPLCKLTTARQAVTVTSEIIESFGGAGYVEDTGLPRILRDAQVLSIWEGTTNVLSLDALRAIAKGDALSAYTEEVSSLVSGVSDPELGRAGRVAVEAATHASTWAIETAGNPAALEAGARRFALTLGRALELALLVRHAAWSLEHERDGRAAAAAVRFAWHGVDLLATDASLEPTSRDASALANDTPIERG